MSRKKGSHAQKEKEQIIIDESRGLVFSSEADLFEHFKTEIEQMETEFFSLRNEEIDLPEDQFTRYERNLSLVLEAPDEIWESEEKLAGQPTISYIRMVDSEKPLYHVAVVYLTENVPSFVYLHFPTRDLELVQKYQRGELAFSRREYEALPGAIEGDALTESDELAVGLYQAMVKLRQDADLPEDIFRRYRDLRDQTIEEADEIWRTTDSLGNVLVTFVKDFSDEVEKDLIYVVVTLEDQPTNSHALLFSFPTRDKQLVQRYRHGENLQADEVVQEASH